jgi:hypothetical protein
LASVFSDAPNVSAARGLFGVGGVARVMGFMDHIEKRHPQKPH